MSVRTWGRGMRAALPMIVALALGAPGLVAQEAGRAPSTPAPTALEGTGASGPAELAPREAAGTLVVLVRHAERADDDPRDPNLSAAGHERARALATMLRDAAFTAIWTTDYKRTRQTAAPLAGVTGLSPQLYDPSGPGLAAFAERLRATPGRHLVVGHSNTTPDLVAALGGAPGGDIDEFEYDRLYVLVIAADGEVTATLLRFGAAFEAAGTGG